MGKRIDAKGQKCPVPVLMAKKEIEAGESGFFVEVDNETAVRNLEKLARSRGFDARVQGEGGAYCVAFSRAADAPVQQRDESGDWAAFISRDCIGGDGELGQNLMRMYLYTLSQGECPPSALLLMNGGVRLATTDGEAAGHLKALRDSGTEILVCGTCLNYYSLADQLQVGEVSNMYDITLRMARAAKVVSL